ncbi:Hcn4 [Symbiodinium necroappetens]|uniref:Hcn4 protein n=1 Tax=Symbiodinium necroappetens TaxID=1628268 RepID=A0A812KY68_9DINO|nr:Hcn4 [Symbiodinium necroappetens]
MPIVTLRYSTPCAPSAVASEGSAAASCPASCTDSGQRVLVPAFFNCNSFSSADAPRVYNERTRKFEYAFFADRNPKFVETLGKFLEKEMFDKDEFIIKEGDKGYSMYFVCSGRASMCSGADLREIHTLTRGAHCGELALYGISHRSFSVIALERTECLVLKNRFFQAVLERFPEEKEYFAEVAAARKQELKLSYEYQRQTRRRDRRIAWHGEKEQPADDSDRDATDDPAPSLPEVDTSAPLPDSEIPGQVPELSHLSVMRLCAPPAPPRNGPSQLAPLGQVHDRVRNGRRSYQHRMVKELATVGHAALARRLEVAAAVQEDMQPPASSSLIPTARPGRSHSLVQVPALEPARLNPSSRAAKVSKSEDLPQLPSQPLPSASKAGIEYEDANREQKKVLQEDDDDDDGFSFLNMDLNAIDPWARAVSA